MIKKLTPFLLFTMLYCNATYTQELHNRNTNWEKENLKENIQSYTEISEPQKQIVDEISGPSKTKFVFNKQGHLIERSFYNYRLGDFDLQWTYKYDNQGNQIEFRECTGNDLHQKKCILSKYTYKKKGNQTEIKLYEIREFLPESEDGDYTHKKWIYTYNNKGYLIEAEEYRGEKDLHTVNNYIYDNKGNLTTKKHVYNEKEYSKTSYKYDKKGNMLEWKYWASNDNDLNKIITYSYDDKENIVEKSFRKYTDGKIYRIYSYKYEYDRHDNWKKCIEYKNGTPINILKRTYEYFEK